MGSPPSKAEASPYIRYAGASDDQAKPRPNLLKCLAGHGFGLLVLLYGLFLCVFQRGPALRSERLARFRRYFDGEAYDVPPFMMMVNAYLHTLCEEGLTAAGTLEDPSVELGAGEGSFSQIALTDRKISLISSVQPSDGPHLARRSVARQAAIIDAEFLPLASGSVRSIYLIDTFYHIRNQEGALGEISRPLEAGGLVSFNYVSPDFFRHCFPLVRWGRFPGLGGLGRWELRRLMKRHFVDVIQPLPQLIDMIEKAGLELVSARPIASARAMRAAYQLYWLASPSRFGFLAGCYRSPWIRRFLDTLIVAVFLPLLQTDSRDSSGGKSIYFWISARKKGSAVGGQSKGIRYVCPLCKSPFPDGPYRCAPCAREFPVTGGVPNFLVHAPGGPS